MPVFSFFLLLLLKKKHIFIMKNVFVRIYSSSSSCVLFLCFNEQLRHSSWARLPFILLLRRVWPACAPFSILQVKYYTAHNRHSLSNNVTHTQLNRQHVGGRIAHFLTFSNVMIIIPHRLLCKSAYGCRCATFNTKSSIIDMVTLIST